MLYVITTEEAPNSLPRRTAAREAHMARMAGMQAEGRIVVSGPCPTIDSPDPGPAGYSGSVIIAEFDSLQAARAWVDEDPYVAAGIWTKVSVRPFRKGFPG
jgi:uncharacterized protein